MKILSGSSARTGLLRWLIRLGGGGQSALLALIVVTVADDWPSVPLSQGGL